MNNKFSILLLVLSFAFTFSCKNKEANKAEETQATETTATDAATATGEGTAFSVNTEASKLMWVGSKPTGRHNGTINISEGSVSVNEGMITGGSLVFDMTSITNLDLEGDQKAGLEAHLKGTAEGKEDHFFDVTKYPTATFEITKVSALESNDNNALIYGDLTLKGVTKQVGFPAIVFATDNDVKVKAKSFKINRTDWGVNHMSKSVVDDLKDKFINDDIELSFTVVAK